MGFFKGFFFFQNFIFVCVEGEGGWGEKTKIENCKFLLNEFSKKFKRIFILKRSYFFISIHHAYHVTAHRCVLGITCSKNIA